MLFQNAPVATTSRSFSSGISESSSLWNRATEAIRRAIKRAVRIVSHTKAPSSSGRRWNSIGRISWWYYHRTDSIKGRITREQYQGNSIKGTRGEVAGQPDRSLSSSIRDLPNRLLLHIRIQWIQFMIWISCSNWKWILLIHTLIAKTGIDLTVLS